MTMDHKEYLRWAYRHGMVLVPRKPTQAMLYVGEGITDFVLPDDVFENTKESRIREIETAWEAMIGQWEYELAIMQHNVAMEKIMVSKITRKNIPPGMKEVAYNAYWHDGDNADLLDVVVAVINAWPGANSEQTNNIGVLLPIKLNKE